MGERRWRATQAGRPGAPIPAIILATPRTTQLLRDALLENLHRSELNPLEEAAAYQQLLEEIFCCTQEELARPDRPLPPADLATPFGCCELPPDGGSAGWPRACLSAGHARALLGHGRRGRDGADGPARRRRGALGAHRRGARHARATTTPLPPAGRRGPAPAARSSTTLRPTSRTASRRGCGSRSVSARVA